MKLREVPRGILQTKKCLRAFYFTLQKWKVAKTKLLLLGRLQNAEINGVQNCDFCKSLCILRYFDLLPVPLHLYSKMDGAESSEIMQ